MAPRFPDEVSSYKRGDHFGFGIGKGPRSLDGSCLIAHATGDLGGKFSLTLLSTWTVPF